MISEREMGENALRRHYGRREWNCLEIGDQSALTTAWVLGYRAASNQQNAADPPARGMSEPTGKNSESVPLGSGR
jgi:hypothetical protein